MNYRSGKSKKENSFRKFSVSLEIQQDEKRGGKKLYTV
jgi:hypothetical protein